MLAEQQIADQHINILKRKQANNDAVLGVNAKSMITEATGSAVQVGIFSGFFGFLDEIDNSPAKTFLLPAALLIDGIKASITLYEWWVAKNKNLPLLSKLFFEVAKFAAVAVAIIGTLVAATALAIASPYIFVGVLGYGTVQNAIMARRHGREVKRLEQEKQLVGAEHFQKQNELDYHLAQRHSRRVGMGISFTSTVAVILLMIFIPPIAIVKKIVSFASMIYLGINAIYLAYKAAQLVKNRKKEIELPEMPAAQQVDSPRPRAQPQLVRVANPQAVVRPASAISTNSHSASPSPPADDADDSDIDVIDDRARLIHQQNRELATPDLLTMHPADVAIYMKRKGDIEAQKTFLLQEVIATKMQEVAIKVEDANVQNLEVKSNRNRFDNKYLALYYLSQLIANNRVNVFGEQEIIAANASVGGLGDALELLQQKLMQHGMTGWRNSAFRSFFKDIGGTSSIFAVANEFAANRDSEFVPLQAIEPVQLVA